MLLLCSNPTTYNLSRVFTYWPWDLTSAAKTQSDANIGRQSPSCTLCTIYCKTVCLTTIIKVT